MYLKLNENENNQNLQDAAKTALRVKFIVLNAYVRKQNTSQINDFNSHLKTLSEEEQKKSKIRQTKRKLKSEEKSEAGKAIEINRKKNTVKPKPGSLTR